ncbi:alpha/beta hydrolase [Brevundimonas sp. 2R-24]|uniref:Alpha/beta hydrolase n=1 Tax=Peiella sedimenti TaxID=3061083 RepID=A0ABT8SHX3_9CAUL|nr:alpha/beta hydrolase [Caulobacteraceae bacterium XZ-24]
MPACLTRRSLVTGLSLVAAAGPAVARQRGGQDRRGLAGPPPDRVIAFGPHPLQSLQLHGEGSGPVLLFVHGGGWSQGSRTHVGNLPEFASRHGLVLASTGYRLAPEATPADMAADIASAIAALRAAAPGRQVWLIGHSAGAHLAALVAVAPRYLGAHGLAPADLAGVILLDGAGYDATQPRSAGLYSGMVERMYAQAFGENRAELSPTLLVQPGRAYPPFLIFHVARREESAQQSRRLAEALRAAGGEAEVVPAPADTHMTIRRDFGLVGDPEGERAAAWMLARGPR